ncbi:MAG: YabP/YqfC family sporulation protein [Lachnospiraceae bacterium]|nr:YabP/YqfC family sporulation protein [Lachnospiraceae bacterium]
MTLEGRERVCIENFKGICSYTEQEVSLMTYRSQIFVRGRRLRIDSYTKDQIEISGLIEMIKYE